MGLAHIAPPALNPDVAKRGSRSLGDPNKDCGIDPRADSSEASLGSAPLECHPSLFAVGYCNRLQASNAQAATQRLVETAHWHHRTQAVRGAHCVVI